MWFSKKTNPRRTQLRRGIAAERFSKISMLVNTEIIGSCLLWLAFTAAASFVLSFDAIFQGKYIKVISTIIIVMILSLAGAIYINHYQRRIVKNQTRAMALCILFVLLLSMCKIGLVLSGHLSWLTATAVAAAIILSIAYDQRFAIGMSMLYCLFASFCIFKITSINLFLIMAAGAITCCFSLREIRTRMKLLEVSATAAAIVLITSASLDFLSDNPNPAIIFKNAGWHGAAALLVGVLIQSLLPLIEKGFRIATSMTLLDYSDANQPLLRRLAMEAPGTFSHCLLVGSIAEAAAESIHRNGLLCRVGAYYHDIGKINKPGYFVENEMGSASRHKELSPAMSQLIIVGHVKDGVEMAKEYKLPAVLRQFIDTHHGTMLVEYFYNEALKKQDQKQSPPSENEFRYVGPKPKTKEAAIVMLADASESAARSLPDPTLPKIEALVHNMAMKRLQDGQFDECDLSLRELSQIETSLSKSLAAHYHGRIPYPTQIEELKQKTEDAAEDQ